VHGMRQSWDGTIDLGEGQWLCRVHEFSSQANENARTGWAEIWDHRPGVDLWEHHRTIADHINSMDDESTWNVYCHNGDRIEGWGLASADARWDSSETLPNVTVSLGSFRWFSVQEHEVTPSDR